MKAFLKTSLFVLVLFLGVQATAQNIIRPEGGEASFSIGVFGGSLSVNRESNAAKQIWADRLGADVITYGVGGAGFSSLQGHSIQRQVDSAGVHDVYVLWASTNDFVNSRECGARTDTTATTQCGGINYCIRTLLEKNPHARIVFFTSLPFFGTESGHDPYSTQTNSTGKTFAQYIEAQKECCRQYAIPVLDQFSLCGFNEYNYGIYYLRDRLHMNEDGYRHIAPLQAAFLAGIVN